MFSFQTFWVVFFVWKYCIFDDDDDDDDEVTVNVMYFNDFCFADC